MKKIGLFFSPKSHILLKNVDISPFHLLILVLWLIIWMSTFRCRVLSLEFSNPVLSLKGNFTELLEFLSVLFKCFFILLECVSVFLEFFLIFLNFLCEMLVHFLSLIFGNAILVWSCRFTFLFSELIVLMLKLFDISLELRSHSCSLLIVSYEFVILLIVVGIFFINPFILNSDFLILITKNIVLILKLMEFKLHFALFFESHSFLFRFLFTFHCLLTILSL